MAIQVPNIQGGNQGMADMPSARAGNYIDASQLGGNQYRDLANLSRAGLQAGNSILAAAQAKRRDEDETFVRDAVTNMHKRFADQSKAVYDQYKGKDAAKVPEEIAKLGQQIREDISKTLQNKYQREGFEQAYVAFDGQISLSAINYRDQQMEFAKQQSLDEQNLQFTDKIAGVATQEGPQAALSSAYFQMIIDNVRTKTRGQSDEVVDGAIRRELRTVHTNTLSNLAATDPKSAMIYLDDERVAGVFSPAEMKKMRETFKESSVNNDINLAAMSWADAGVESAEAFRLAYEQFPDSADAPENALHRRQLLAVYDDYSRRKKDSANLQAVQETGALWESFVDNGYSMEAMTPDEQRAVLRNPKLRQEFISLRDFVNKINPDDAVPDFEELNRIRAMKPSEIRAWLAEKPSAGKMGNYTVLQLWAGPEKKEAADIMERSRLDDNDPKATGQRTGSGGGEAGFDVKQAFEQNFTAFAMNKGRWSDSVYDPRNEDHKRLSNNFQHIYRLRIGDPAQFPGKSPNTRGMDLFYGIIQDVNAGKLDLNKPTYDEYMQRYIEAGQEAPGDFNMLTPAERVMTRGMEVPVIIKQNVDTGETNRFGKLSLTTESGTGILDRLLDAEPREALLAYDRGTIRAGDRTAAFEPGWRIITSRTGYTDIYDQKWVNRASLPPAAQNSIAEESEGYSMPLYQPQSVHNAVMEAAAKYQGEGTSLTWNPSSKFWVLTTPAGVRHWNENGELQDYILFHNEPL